MITSQDLVAWADRKACEILLPVLVRRLVHETNARIQMCDFPGGDGAQIGGWDGITDIEVGNAWTPRGRAGWEMGKQKNVKGKADDDYVKRLALPADERAGMSFVFVTPRRWRSHTDRTGREAWLKARRAAGDFAAVEVIDADALEQWLEQAPATHQWLAETLGRHFDGLMSPERAWTEWAAPTVPPLTPAIFSEPVTRAQNRLETFFAQPPTEPMAISADRREEALALTTAILQTPPYEAQADRGVVVSSDAALTHVLAAPPPLVIIADRALETRLGDLPRKTRVIIVTSHGEHDGGADIVLDPLSPDAFRDAVQTLTGDRNQADRWARESGKSITILRRRLTPLNRRPAWSSDPALASRLTVFALAGGWVNADRKAADEALLVRLGRRSASELDLDFQQFASIADPPVFSIAGVRSVTSRIDALEAVRPWFTRDDLERYFVEFAAILEDPDPSLDLPEDERWMANVRGKSRALSGRLRRGLLETAILLDIHAADIRKRVQFDVAARISVELRKALPISEAKPWLDLRDSLRILAEAAPDTFLDILEADLDSGAPGVLALIKPVPASIMSENLRTELVWALELLAWHPSRFARVADVLTRLSRIELKDNHVNKPAYSLASLFRSWSPRTAAPLERRVAVLRSLCRREPDTLWPIVVGMFEAGPAVAFSTARPRWREDATAQAEPSMEDHWAMVQAAMDIALTWPHPSSKTLGDLVEASTRFSPSDQARLWTVVETWSAGRSEGERSDLADRIRTRLLTVRAFGRHGHVDYAKAREVYEALRPQDPVLRHAYLFAKDWIQLEADGSGDAKLDRRDQDLRIKALRTAALVGILNSEGSEGLVRLVDAVDGLRAIGWSLADAELGLENEEEVLSALLQSDLAPAKVDAVMTNYFGSLVEETRPAMLDRLTETFADQAARILLWVSPTEDVRARLATLPEDQVHRYWTGVPPWMPSLTPSLQRWLVEGLLAVDRPRTAFHAIHLDLENAPVDLVSALLRGMITVERDKDAMGLPATYDIAAGFARLDTDTAITRDTVAELEFWYLEALVDESERGPKALSQLMASSPEAFVEMLAHVYPRDDGTDRDETVTERDGMVAQQAYMLLSKLSVSPGLDAEGVFDSERFADFVTTVRTRAAAIDRTFSAESVLGEWLARAAPFADHDWPPPHICAVLEEAGAEDMRRSYSLSLRNARGIVTKSYYGGGDQERALGARFRAAAQAVAEAWPRVGRMLDGIAGRYEAEGADNDEDATLRRRTDI